MPIDDCVPGQRLKSIRSFIALAVVGRRRRRRRQRCARNIVFFFLYHFTNLVCIYTIIIYYSHRFHGPAVSVNKTLARYIFSIKLEQIRFLEWNRAVVVYRMHIITYRYTAVSKLPRRRVFPYARVITCLMEILILTRTLQRPKKKK